VNAARAALAALTFWRHLPAAPDNQPGRDTDALWTCRRISALPVTDPDISRTAIRYLRNRKEKPQP
jgi:hypothetical protein